MITFPIIEEVGILGTRIDSLKVKIVENLISKEVTDVSTDMTLSQLVDKILDIVPASLAEPFPIYEPLEIDNSLTILSNRLNIVYDKFKFNLSVMGVTNIPSDATFNTLADKILEIEFTPKYDLYPESLVLEATGAPQPFFFNTLSTSKIDLSIENNIDNCFSLETDSLQGPGKFVVRVFATNNLQAIEKSGARVKISVDGIDRYVTLKQLAGVKSETLISPRAALGTSFKANGVNTTNPQFNYTTFQATHNTYWNGILTNSALVDGSSSDFSISIDGQLYGFTIENTPKYGTLRAPDRGITLHNPVTLSVKCAYKGLVANVPVIISQEQNKVVGYVNTKVEIRKGNQGGTILSVIPASGLTSTLSADNSYFPYLYGQAKYTSGSLDIVRPNTEFTRYSYSSSNPNFNFYIPSGGASSKAIGAASRGTVVGDKLDGIVTIQSFDSNNISISASIPISQEKNSTFYKRLILSIVNGGANHPASGGETGFKSEVIRGYTSGEETSDGVVLGYLTGSAPGFSINANTVTSENRGAIEGPSRSITVGFSYMGLTAPETFVITQAENKAVSVQSTTFTINKAEYSASNDVVIVNVNMIALFSSGATKANYPLGEAKYTKHTVPGGSTGLNFTSGSTQFSYPLNSRGTNIDTDKTRGEVFVEVNGLGMPSAEGRGLIVSIVRSANKVALSGTMTIDNQRTYKASSDNFTFKVVGSAYYTSGSTQSITTFDSVRRDLSYTSSAIINTFNTNGAGSCTFNSLGAVETSVESGIIKVSITKFSQTIEVSSPVIKREANSWYDKRVSLEVTAGSLSHRASGDITIFKNIVWKGWTSGSESAGSSNIGTLKLSTTTGFEVQSNSVVSPSRETVVGPARSTTVSCQYGSLVAPETFVITQEANNKTTTTEVVDSTIRYRCSGTSSMPYNIQRDKYTYTSGSVTYGANRNVDQGIWAERDGKCGYVSKTVTLGMSLSPSATNMRVYVNGKEVTWSSNQISFPYNEGGQYNFENVRVNGSGPRNITINGSGSWTRLSATAYQWSNGTSLSGSCGLTWS